METILIVDDDADIVEILSACLEHAGFSVLAASNGEQGVEMLKREKADVILVDILMPKMNGYEFIKAVREFNDAPIIVISARNLAADKVMGLDLGADGYITKPFDITEVVFYVKAMLRRVSLSRASALGEGQSRAGDCIVAGDLLFDTHRMELLKNGRVVRLTAAELKIVLRLMRSPGRIFTKGQLYEAAFGEVCLGAEESIMVHISNIRAKLDDGASSRARIVTVRGLASRSTSSGSAQAWRFGAWA